MSITIKKALKIVIPLVFGGILVWYSLSNISIKTLLYYFKNANYWWIALGIFFGILSHLSRAYRWKFMLEPLGYIPKFPNSVMAVLIAYLVNCAVPRAGEVSRAVVLSNYENIPFEKGFGTIVSERIADLLMLLIIVIITLFLQFDFIYRLLLEKFNPLKMLLLLGGFGIVFVVFSIYVKKAKTGIAFKIKNFIKGLIEGITSIFKMKKKGFFIAHTFFIWAMYLLMFWATIPAIKGLQVPLGGVLIGFIAGGLSIAATNGGVGLYPVAVAGAFALFNIGKEPASAFGWIMWTAQTAMFIVFGGISFLFLPVYNRGK